MRLESAQLAQEPLEKILMEVRAGLIQVPEFQREVVLTNLWIAELLASVSLGYPIGAVTLLAAGNREYHFAARPVNGAPSCDRNPGRFLVDGQHRVGALYQALAHSSVGPADDVRRAFYMDMNRALENDADRSDAIVWGLPQHQEGRNLFPLSLVFASAFELRRWEDSFLETSQAPDLSGRTSLLAEFSERVLVGFRRYRLATILLDDGWTAWTMRVRAGQNGRVLREKYRRG